MERKKSLLEKYDIPLNHLDFKYIEKCHDAREMEKIVQILRSGEEGYYPDLTTCAENKLRQLKPESRHFRLEEPIRSRDALPASEWRPIYDWNHKIKEKDKTLEAVAKSDKDIQQNGNALDLPPIRKTGIINIVQEDSKDNQTVATTTQSSQSKDIERIKLTDYSKWDKFDVDVECLKIDLAEERISEEVERKNRLNATLSAPTPKIEEILNETEQKKELWENLADVEREKLANDYRMRGNEYFRAKEYDYSLAEYTKAIKMWPASAGAAFNNRALVYLKIKKYAEAIEDCKECLKVDPNNVKALLRQAEATSHNGKNSDALPLYQRVLAVDPENKLASRMVDELHLLLGERPPADATRLQIKEHAGGTTTKKSDKNSKAEDKKQTTPKKKEYDLVELVKPNVILNELGQGNPCKSLDSPKIPKQTKNSPDLLLRTDGPTRATPKMLIEEIS